MRSVDIVVQFISNGATEIAGDDRNNSVAKA